MEGNLNKIFSTHTAMKNAYEMFVGKFRRFRRRGLDNIEMNLKEVGVFAGFEVAQCGF
jgi:hypothetical protein